MADQTDAALARHMVRAIFSPHAILIALVTLAGAILLSPWLLAPGTAAWVIAVMATAGRRAHSDRTAAIDTTALPPSIQADLQGVNAALDALQRALARIPEDQRILFANLEDEAHQVRDAVVRMAQAAGALHQHLAVNRADELRLRLAVQRQHLASTDDPAARASLEAEIARGEQRLERLEDMLATLERYRRALRELQQSVQDLADRAVNLSAGGELALHDQYDERSPGRRIAELRASVAALEEVMRPEVIQEH